MKPVVLARSVTSAARMTSAPVLWALAVLLFLLMGTLTIASHDHATRRAAEPPATVAAQAEARAQR